MRVIHKYQLGIHTYQKITTHLEPYFLCVQMQDGIPCIWAMVNPEEPKVGLVIEILPTGANFENADRAYIGTFQIPDERLVFHVFHLLK